MVMAVYHELKCFCTTRDFAQALMRFKAVGQILCYLSAGDFHSCFEQWKRRWDKCIELKGDYCESFQKFANISKNKFFQMSLKT